MPLTLRGGTDASIVSKSDSESLKRQLSSLIDEGLTLINRIRDVMSHAQCKQNEYMEKKLNHEPTLKLVSSVGSNKLKHRFIGPFAVLARHGTAYTIDLPKSMATHPTFYVGRLKRYHDPLGLPSRMEEDQGENSPPRNEAEPSGQPELPVAESVSDKQTGTHASHTRGMTERRRSGKRQMLVKWRGYPSSQNSWEPEDRLRVDYPKAFEIWDQTQQPGRK
ncbi:Pol protein [Phytophthora palmivora]|uniref:Pol protein n=1 Tax=Phytophthora palmivora TaxID=4796 RepID=A0A2P4XUD4_9STRA|nr:Pol protein [Phytophthora palmivora]